MSQPTFSREWEEGLVAQAVNGDEAAFTRLYDHYFDRIYRHIYYRIGRSEDAEDLTQQVFLQAWRALSRYRQMGSPLVAWLLTIAHNVVVTFYRRAKPAHSVGLEAEDWPSDEQSEEQLEGAAEARLEYERVREKMRLLKPEHQQVLAMRFLEDLPCQDIAAALGKSEGNVRVIQHRALNELRRILDRREP